MDIGVTLRARGEVLACSGTHMALREGGLQVGGCMGLPKAGVGAGGVKGPEIQGWGLLQFEGCKVLVWGTQGLQCVLG